MLKSQALLSLWNGFDPDRLDEYDLWHTREHVPERLAVPGMLRARRLHRGEGPLPSFLTLYELDSSAVLASDPYRRLLENPTTWSRGMRPSFQGFFRVGHRVVLSRGGGAGGALMATTFADPGAPDGGWEEIAAIVLRETRATAIHVLAKDERVAPVPFAVPGGAGHADGAALMVECYDRARLGGIAEVLDAALDSRRMALGRAAWTRYELAYLLDRDELAEVATLGGPLG
jgi:hypothetical protein